MVFSKVSIGDGWGREEEKEEMEKEKCLAQC